MGSRKTLIAVALTLIGMTQAAACLWDRDTLAMERGRFPDALELITGKFLRRSEALYRWRIKNLSARLAKESSVRLIDDLAVAYDKVGEHDRAIEWMEKTLEDYPDRYESYANLGTFHIHSGDLTEGLRYIDKALAINPEAHFGREEYQRLLVLYLRKRPAAEGAQVAVKDPFASESLEDPTSEKSATEGTAAEKSADGRPGAAPTPEVEPPEAGRDNKSRMTLPLQDVSKIRPQRGRFGFAKFVVDEKELVDPQAKDDEKREQEERASQELEKATKGVLGMMRFGHYDSPVLLEALGDLLASAGVYQNGDAKLLAARAYLKASYEVEDKVARDGYRTLAKAAISSQTTSPVTYEQISLKQVERDFQAELQEASKWYAAVESDEKKWIAEGVDVDAQFEKKYYDAPVVGRDPGHSFNFRNGGAAGGISWRRLATVGVLLGLGLVTAVVGTTFLLMRKSRGDTKATN